MEEIWGVSIEAAVGKATFCGGADAGTAEAFDPVACFQSQFTHTSICPTLLLGMERVSSPFFCIVIWFIFEYVPLSSDDPT